MFERSLASRRPSLVIVRDLPAEERAALESVARQLGIPVAELVEHAMRLREAREERR